MGPKTGLSNVLTGNATLQQAVVRSSILPTLFVLTAGTPPPNPAELLASSNMRDILAELREQYDHIIVDTPPTLSVTDAVVMSTRADAVVLVIRSGQTTKQALRRARDLLMQVNAKGCGSSAERRRPDFPRLLLLLRIPGKIRPRYYQEDELVDGEDSVPKASSSGAPVATWFVHRSALMFLRTPWLSGLHFSGKAEMRIPLTSPARKISLVLASALLLAGYLWFVSRELAPPTFPGGPTWPVCRGRCDGSRATRIIAIAWDVISS